MAKSKLHEILAVEGDLENTAKKILSEANALFTKKPDHFIETVRTMRMFDDSRSGENTEETSKMVTSVLDKLSYIKGPIIKYWDAVAKKEATNQTAKADVVVDDKVLLSGVPATALLGLETKLKTLRGQVYEVIPTLQPGIDWEEDPTRVGGIYRSKHPEERLKTEKTINHKVLVEPTKEHPAQIEQWWSDQPVGKITLNQWSGMMSPAKKSELLARIDTLIRAIKKARQRANNTETVDISVGAKLFNYIENGQV